MTITSRQTPLGETPPGETLAKRSAVSNIVHRATSSMPDDGTRELLRAAFWILLTGGIAAVLTETVAGGIGIHGPHTNLGWLLLILAMMCLPFGTMLLLLGVAKWLRNRRLPARRR